MNFKVLYYSEVICMSLNALELERQKYRLDPRRKTFSFELPEELEEAITDLLMIYDEGRPFDCEQENLRTIAHTELEEDDAQEVLNYYYRRNYW